MPGAYVSRVWRHDPTLDAPASYRAACRYEAFIPDRLAALSVHLEGSAAGVVSEADAAIRNLNRSDDPAMEPLARLLLRTESIASSKIEGMQAGVRAVARAEAGGRASATALEVLANIDAMELAMDEASAVERFSEAELLAIHRRLMERAPDAARNAGRLRTQQNWIGGSDFNPCGADFVPPPPEEVEGLLTDLYAAMADDRLPPLVQAALVHAQFETIHPFGDGNGRTGRALIHVVLRRRGVAARYVPPISVVLAANRNRYIAGLTGFRGDGVGEWIAQFAAAARSAALLAEEYLGRVRGLRDRWRERLRSRPGAPRADAAAWAVMKILPAHPVLTAPVAAAATGRSRPQIYRAIGQLEDAEVLRPLTQGRRNRAWEASGLIELLERLDGGVVG
jgi:Fic family protein